MASRYRGANPQASRLFHGMGLDSRGNLPIWRARLEVVTLSRLTDHNLPSCGATR